jgi:D-glycero-D-manno-heptose 1,7-bisphosphate phosphatase
LSDRAVFFDRDGVIVELVWDEVDGAFESPNVKDDVQLVPAAPDAIRRIRSLDYRTVVVSNQPGVAKGKVSREDLLGAHEHVVRLLAERQALMDDYRYCLHHPRGTDAILARACECRKPKPGMLLQAADDLGIDLTRSWMIGDSDADAEAGRLAGCRTILVENPQSAHRRQGDSHVDYRVRDVAQAAAILERNAVSHA